MQALSCAFRAFGPYGMMNSMCSSLNKVLSFSNAARFAPQNSGKVSISAETLSYKDVDAIDY